MDLGYSVLFPAQHYLELSSMGNGFGLDKQCPWSAGDENTVFSPQSRSSVEHKALKYLLIALVVNPQVYAVPAFSAHRHNIIGLLGVCTT